VLNVLLVSLTVLVLIAEWLAPAFVKTILVPGLPPAEQALTTTLTRIMLLHSLILGLGTIATAVLNGKRQFLLPALSTAIYDVGLIGGLLVSQAIPSVGIYGPTYGLLASAVCQVAVQIPGLHKQGAHYTWLWDLRHPGLHEMVRLLLPNMLAVGIASIGTILETSFASYLPDPASIPAMRNASLLFGLPLTLVAQVIGQALLPQLTTQATNGRYVRMSLTLLQIVSGCMLLSIPAAIALSLLGRPAIALVFQHGAFDAHASMLTATALLGYALGLPGLTASNLLILSFYALKDARTPLLTNVGTLAARIGLIFLLLKVFRGDSAILALPLAASLVGTGEALLLGLLLFIRLRTKVRTDKGLQRLQQRREYAKRQPTSYKPLTGP
jgi:putative peptidoglycan lipid II flippase